MGALVMRQCFALAACIGLGALSPPVQADDTKAPVRRANPLPDFGPDEVVLETGGTVRGTIITLEPGQRVVLEVFGEKAPRTILWEHIHGVEPGKFAGRDESAEQKAALDDAAGALQDATEASDERPLPRGVVRLHIETEDPNVAVFELKEGADLEDALEDEEAEHRREVCRMPCDALIDGRDGRVFWFDGEGVETSDEFTLRDRQGTITANVAVGRQQSKSGGKALTVTGLSLAGGSVPFIALGIIQTGQMDDLGEGDSMLGFGVALASVGVLLTAIGVPFWASHDTEFELQETSTDSPPRPLAGNPFSFAW